MKYPSDPTICPEPWFQGGGGNNNPPKPDEIRPGQGDTVPKS